MSSTTKARTDNYYTEYVTCFSTGCILHVTVPTLKLTNGANGTETLARLQDFANALQISYVPENQLTPEFFALYKHLPVKDLPEASEDVAMRCAALRLLRTNTNMSNVVKYIANPIDNGCLFVHTIRSKGQKYSTASANDTGLVKEGNLLQVLRMRRTFTAVFNCPSEVPTKAENIEIGDVTTEESVAAGTVKP
jgi:hypothetical protein